MRRRTPSGTFKVRQRVYLARCVTDQWWWTFDVPVKILKRYPNACSTGDAYLVRHENGYSPRAVECIAEVHLSPVAVSYPGLTWDEVMEERGAPKRRIAA